MAVSKGKRSRLKPNNTIESRAVKARKHVSNSRQQSAVVADENSRSSGNVPSCIFNVAGQVVDVASSVSDKHTGDLSQVGDPSPTDKWQACMTKAEREAYRNQELKHYARDKLFPRVKLISHPTQLQYSSDKQSFCQTICKELRVVKEYRRDWWTHHCKDIRDELNKRRSEVTSRMRKIFICKLIKRNVP